jgi:uncharacterized cupredoxin-like copper-binding protein
MNYRIAAVGMTAALALAGCSSDGDSHEHGSGSEFTFGQPGDPTKATRTVEVKMGDDLRYDPATIAVKPGETVTFRVTNSGAQLHEFILGDEEFHKEHDKEMMEMGGGAPMRMPDEPEGINIDPGQTEQITWTFPDRPETVTFACHEPGHWLGGMKGNFTVSS